MFDATEICFYLLINRAMQFGHFDFAKVDVVMYHVSEIKDFNYAFKAASLHCLERQSALAKKYSYST